MDARVEKAVTRSARAVDTDTDISRG